MHVIKIDKININELYYKSMKKVKCQGLIFKPENLLQYDPTRSRSRSVHKKGIRLHSY